jgi:hypothetical protein
MLDALPETDSNRGHPVGFQGIGGGRPTPRGGRPKPAPDICELIGETSVANPLWRAPRIHGELLKLETDIRQITVPKYMARKAATFPPSRGREDLRS